MVQITDLVGASSSANHVTSHNVLHIDITDCYAKFNINESFTFHSHDILGTRPGCIAPASPQLVTDKRYRDNEWMDLNPIV